MSVASFSVAILSIMSAGIVSVIFSLEHRREPDYSVPAAVGLDELRRVEVCDTDTEETYDLLSTAGLACHSRETNTVRGHSLIFPCQPSPIPSTSGMKKPTTSKQPQDVWGASKNEWSFNLVEFTG